MADLVIYWCRRDFRLTDNPALSQAFDFAVKNNFNFLPIYVLDENLLKGENIGFVRKKFLSQVLAGFRHQFQDFVVFNGKYQGQFEALSKQFKLYLFVNEDVEPYAIERDKIVKTVVEKNGGNFYNYADQISVNKSVTTGSNNIYSVFSPFRNTILEEFLASKSLLKVEKDKIVAYQKSNTIPIESFNFIKRLDYIDLKNDNEENSDLIFKIIDSKNILSFGEHKIDLDQIIDRPNLSNWYFTENDALTHFDDFLNKHILNYKVNRDDLGNDAKENGMTSKMSAALKWGLVSARTIKDLIIEKYTISEIYKNQNLFHYISELIWREFYRYVLFHNPEVLELEFQKKFQNTIEWEQGQKAVDIFKKWILGQTGYPIVDAAMNQIAQMGWMHNRSRMIVASILTKNLGIDWRWGQNYFRTTLIDLDEASNNGGWQWAASVGADPKPIRIFNPYLQAENYDKKNLYQKKWLPSNYDYQQEPIIEHKKARDLALKRYGLASNRTVRDY
jgi:deoxyribodipyrimidine photo-lyase